MYFLHSMYGSQRWSLPRSSSLRKCRGFPLGLLPLFALLCGCAGVVSPGSGSSETFRLSGTISPQSVGNGTTVALSGPASASTTGDSSGSYSFSGLSNGIYAVTPSRPGYSFSPSVQSVSIDGSNVSGIDFTASQQAIHSVQLTWQASTSNVVGYNIYRSTIDGGQYVRINATLVISLNYTDSSVASSTIYYYVATAVDTAGVESEYSNQASAQIL
jgi:hypothetical protein